MYLKSLVLLMSLCKNGRHQRPKSDDVPGLVPGKPGGGSSDGCLYPWPCSLDVYPKLMTSGSLPTQWEKSTVHPKPCLRLEDSDSHHSRKLLHTPQASVAILVTMKMKNMSWDNPRAVKNNKSLTLLALDDRSLTAVDTEELFLSMSEPKNEIPCCHHILETETQRHVSSEEKAQ